MNEDRTLLEARFLKDRARIVPWVYRRTLPLEVEAVELVGEPVPFHDAVKETFSPFAIGSPWGRRWGTTWFRMTADVPEDWAGPLELVVDLGFDSRATGFQCEGLVYSPDGRPLQGVHPNRTAVPLPHVTAGEPGHPPARAVRDRRLDVRLG